MYHTKLGRSIAQDKEKQVLFAEINIKINARYETNRAKPGKAAIFLAKEPQYKWRSKFVERRFDNR